jgi:hypothetical protein
MQEQPQGADEGGRRCHLHGVFRDGVESGRIAGKAPAVRIRRQQQGFGKEQAEGKAGEQRRRLPRRLIERAGEPGAVEGADEAANRRHGGEPDE